MYLSKYIYLLNQAVYRSMVANCKLPMIVAVRVAVAVVVSMRLMEMAMATAMVVKLVK